MKIWDEQNIDVFTANEEKIKIAHSSMQEICLRVGSDKETVCLMKNNLYFH